MIKMALDISIKCDGCGKEFPFAEIERIATVYRTLTRASRSVNVQNTCNQCERKVTARTIKEDYVCSSCLLLKKKESLKTHKPGRPKIKSKLKKAESHRYVIDSELNREIEEEIRREMDNTR